jgi:Uma2 family endonuclease
MPGSPVRHMTAEELFGSAHEPRSCELVAGRLHEMEPPGIEHGVVATQIAKVLDAHVEREGLGLVVASEVGFHIAHDPDTVRAPDVAFLSRERVEEIGIPRGYWPGPPDVAVEVVSPNDRRSEVEGKALDWIAGGTRAVIVVDPDLRTATVYRARDDICVLTADESLDLEDVIPGWHPTVGEFFVARRRAAP